MDPRLQRAIATPKLQTQATDLVRLALGALDGMRQLDEGIYERFLATRQAPDDQSGSAMSLQRLWDMTFRHLIELLAFCRLLGGDAHVAPTNLADPDHLDFGDLDGGGAPAPATAEVGFDLGASDIGDLLEGLDDLVEHDEGEAERWGKVLEKVGSIEYGLSSQLTDATSRFYVALGAGEINQVLGILDDTQSSASEGVHAVVAAVYETFVPDTNPSTVVPGYMTSLGRALLVRRGIADLAATLVAPNDVLQGTAPAAYPAALATVRETVRAFVGSVVCRAMRPADRFQMVEIERELREQPMAAARLTSEGLVKYLDSLGTINQREVLVLHDQRTLDTMREALANARQLVDISPRTATEMIDRAYQSAQRLRGRSPSTDKLLIALERAAGSSPNATESVEFLEQLEAVLAAG